MARRGVIGVVSVGVVSLGVVSVCRCVGDGGRGCGDGRVSRGASRGAMSTSFQACAVLKPFTHIGMVCVCVCVCVRVRACACACVCVRARATCSARARRHGGGYVVGSER